MEPFEAFILAGGASSRMGTDKARLLLDGKTFIERIAGALREFTSDITVVGQEVSDLGLKSVADIQPRLGALGGIQTALTHCQMDWAIVVACDLPFVSASLFQRLAEFRADHEAVVPIQADLVPQPLCALYKVRECLTNATKLLNSGQRRPLDLLQSIRTKWVSFADIEDLPGAHNFFVNINTPHDYYASRKGLRGED